MTDIMRSVPPALAGGSGPNCGRRIDPPANAGSTDSSPWPESSHKLVKACVNSIRKGFAGLDCPDAVIGKFEMSSGHFDPGHVAGNA
jgi:hypothetical protein